MVPALQRHPLSSLVGVCQACLCTLRLTVGQRSLCLFFLEDNDYEGQHTGTAQERCLYAFLRGPTNLAHVTPRVYRVIEHAKDHPLYATPLRKGPHKSPLRVGGQEEELHCFRTSLSALSENCEHRWRLRGRSRSQAFQHLPIVMHSPTPLLRTGEMQPDCCPQTRSKVENNSSVSPQACSTYPHCYVNQRSNMY